MSLSPTIREPPLSTAAPKSPPLAFAPTPNDSLIAPTTTTFAGSPLSIPSLLSPDSSTIPPTSNNVMMGREHLLEAVTKKDQALDKLHRALDGFHRAYRAERDGWAIERAELKDYIQRLQAQLNTGLHYSPAKSPINSPSNGSAILSPQVRALLPTISEDENLPPLAARRDAVPKSIDLSMISDRPQRRRSSVAFLNSDELIVEEDPSDPLPPRQTLSPPPASNIMHAGHTPVRAISRPLTPPPARMPTDGIEDTPTRHNTALNNFLTRSNDEDVEKELTGPLNMPELPNQPGEENFTVDALTLRLQRLGSDPESRRPSIFHQPSPGLASPVEEHPGQGVSSGSLSRTTEPANIPAKSERADSSSSVVSPSNAALLSPQEFAENKLHSDFEQGGIRLKKKPSLNFGAAFGCAVPSASYGPPAGRRMS